MTSTQTPNISWPIVGHPAVVGYLQRAVQNSQTLQAYLLHGPDQLGKCSLARLFARALLCTNTNQRPCEDCPACRNSIHGTHPDFIELAKDPLQQNIGIEIVRDQVVKRLQLSSFLNTYILALINDAQCLSQEAANALLKTLEEPRRKVIIILVANELSALPATVVSRCQTFELFPLSTPDIEQFIRTLQPDIKHNQVRSIAALSRGRPGRAFQLLKEPLELERSLDEYRSYMEILSAPVWQRFELLNKHLTGASFQENKIIAENIINGLAIVLRDEMLRQNGLPGLATYIPDMPPRTTSNDQSLAPRLIHSLTSLRRSLAQNASPRLVLEQFCLEF